MVRWSRTASSPKLRGVGDNLDDRWILGLLDSEAENVMHSNVMHKQ